MINIHDFSHKEVKPLQVYIIEKITKQVAIYQVLSNNFWTPSAWPVTHGSQLTSNNYNLFTDLHINL